MATTPLPSVGERLAEMHLSVVGGSFCWTSELVATGPCVLFVVDAAGTADAALRVRTFDHLGDAFQRRGVSVVGIGADDCAALDALRRAERVHHVRLLADPTAQVCGALGLMNGHGPRACALVVDQEARIRAVVAGASPDGQAAAALDAVEHLWPAGALASA